MEFNKVAAVTAPLHVLLQKVAAPPMEFVAIYPERLTYSYEVSPQREPKFRELVRRMLVLEDTFDLDSPLHISISRSVTLSEDESPELGEWLIQFQVNQHDRADEAIEALVSAQVQAIVFEFESFLYD